MSHDRTTEMIEAQFESMLQRTKARSAEVQAFLAAQAPAVPCDRHPNIMRPINADATREATSRNGGILTAGYSGCPACSEERAEQLLRQRLHEQGVPSVLLQCTLENWIPNGPEEKNYIRTVRNFIEERVGFLLLLGDVGRGKSHLAVGAMRNFHDAFFVKQNTLLRRLRETYHDSKAADPVEECQNAALFILDEAGLSSGGRDELPMLHEILDYRYGERKPTIITGNLNWSELASSLGDRLVDRLRESSVIITFAGESHRAQLRNRYFGAAVLRVPLQTGAS
jgi:DNA replication protein DnaC